MSLAYEKGKAITQAIGYLRFIPSTPNYTALVTFPYLCFQEYTPDPDRMYDRGEVIRVGREKYLIQNDGRIDPNIPPPENSLCKLFRDGGRYDWVREEFCLKDFERYYDDGDPWRSGWYKVISNNVDSSTPPPNDDQNWEKVV